jgi:HAD superfamily hydrolase (TIGR01490 family)
VREKRPTGVAFFDMDRTLVAANTGRIYAGHMRRQGKLGALQLAKVLFVLLQYRLSLVDLHDIMARLISAMKGTEEAPLEREGRELFHREVRALVYREAHDLIERHRDAGEHVVILSASTPYLVRPLAEHLEVHEWLCTRPLVESGLFTGAYEDPICYGKGKIDWARRTCERLGLTLEDAAFYTDSYSDLPLLLAVGRPVAVNPDLRLYLAARRRGWPVMRFRALWTRDVVAPTMVEESEP